MLALASIFLSLGTFLGFVRFLRGPTTLDRLLAFDYLAGCLICFIALHSIVTKSAEYLELQLVFSLIGFATIICFVEVHYAKKEKK